jgi:hypothetical protein
MDAHVDKCMNDSHLVNMTLDCTRTPRRYNCLHSPNRQSALQSGQALKDDSYIAGSAGKIKVIV